MKSKRTTATELAQTSETAVELRMTEQYARMVVRDAYLWARPMINVYNRRRDWSKSPKFAAEAKGENDTNGCCRKSSLVAKSNIFVNTPNETKRYYQDLDSSGARLNGANRYNVMFAKGELPPVRGFWSLTLYNERHFFAPNDLKRYSLGTKNKGLK